MRRFTPVLLALGCGCTQDSAFTKLSDPEPPAQDTSVPPVELVDTGTPLPPECPDAGLVSAAPVARDDACALAHTTIPLTIAEEWSTETHWSSAVDPFPYVNSHPSVGDLTGDGVPDLAVVSYANDGVYYASWCAASGADAGAVRLYSGAEPTEGPRLHWEVQELGDIDTGLEVAPVFHTAMGDIDADGAPELVIGAWYGRDRSDYRVVALAADGSVEWASPILTPTPVSRNYVYGQAGIYDQNQDGVPEIYAYGVVLDGATGSLLWGEGSLPGGPSVVVDLEGDGTQELVTTTGIWNADHTPRCRFGYESVDIAVADINGDGTGDVLASHYGTQGTNHFNHRCESQYFHYGIDSMLIVADFNADGRADLGGKAWSSFSVQSEDGATVWSTAMGANGAGNGSAFDFDADGFLEVVAGERGLYVFSGLDGARRHAYGTTGECYFDTFPMVLDVDPDGQAEIIQTEPTGVHILGDRLNDWPDGLGVWNQQAFHRSHIRDDLSIPAYNGGNWPEFNDFRSSATRPGLGSGSGQIDATVELVNICDIECDRDTVEITARVANQGLRDAADGIGLGVYSIAADGTRTAVAHVPASDMIRAGYTSEGHTFTVSIADLPTDRLVLVADDNGEGRGLITECNEDNNELILNGLCPATE
jgi:hypothetical protein